MPADLQRRGTHSRRRSLKFAALSLLACFGAGALLGAIVGTVALGFVAIMDDQPGGATWMGLVSLILFCCGVGGGLAVLAYLPMLLDAAIRGKKAVLRRAGASAPDRLTAQRLGNVLQELAIAAGLPCPAAAIIVDDFPNAMTAGRRREDATVVVTTGLLATMSRPELEAVLAHEVGHIANGDLGLMTFLAASTARFRRETSFVMQTYSGSIVGAIVWPVGTVARYSLRLARHEMSRERELLADDTAALLTRDPRALIGALTKIASSPAPPHAWKADIAPLFVVDPNHVWSGEDSVSLRERVERLRSLMPEPETALGGAPEAGTMRTATAGSTSPPFPARP
jgi:heat shock protein HtpX